MLLRLAPCNGDVGSAADRYAGQCSHAHPPMLLLELCHNRSLHSFLSQVRVKSDVLYELQPDERLDFAWQIACGMAHIASLHIVHGALTSYAD